jgi:hypothetical protein
MRKSNLSKKTLDKRYEVSRVYKEHKRREAGIPPRKLVNPRFDSKKLANWLEQYLVKVEQKNGNDKVGSPRLHLNGKLLTKLDGDFIRHLRNGQQVRVTLKRVDTLAIKYDLPLWELEEFASRYKTDIRTIRKHRRDSRKYT